MRTVVGVALVVVDPVGGPRVLAARRAAPPALAGRWELPGGKVEPGEPLPAAAVRELTEELGCTVEVAGELVATAQLGEDLQLRVVTARLVAGDPVPHEHGAVRWLRGDQLDEVDWVEADRVFLPELRHVLEPTGGVPA